jgi:hypothetical protein
MWIIKNDINEGIRKERSEMALKCLKDLNDNYVKHSIFDNSNINYINSADFNLNYILNTCEDVLDFNNSTFQNALAFYYGTLGQTDKQHTIYLNSAKNPNYMNNLIDFYLSENNYIEFGQEWIEKCKETDLFCSEIYTRFILATTDSYSALKFLKSLDELSPNLEVTKYSLETTLQNSNLDIRPIKKLADDGYENAQFLIYFDAVLKEDNATVKKYLEAITKQSSTGYVLQALHAQNPLEKLEIFNSCIKNFPLSPDCYQQKADLIFTTYGHSDEDIPADILLQTFDLYQTANSLGVASLGVVRYEFDDITDKYLNSLNINDDLRRVNFEISVLNRASPADIESQFRLASIFYVHFNDLDRACKHYQDGLFYSSISAGNPLGQGDSGIFGRDPLGNNSDVWKRVFELSLENSNKKCLSI